MLDAKTSLSKLVHELETGEATEFIITRNGRPAARLVPLAPPVRDRSRRIGVARGRFKVPQSIDAGNDEVQQLFVRGLCASAALAPNISARAARRWRRGGMGARC
ncbi:type II toxin-antitoxin system Phd/YefM family antitoxin [Pseudaquabacterium terrae]|nr:type II toxin-antitoxin system prevent-host-death family antitoxin [Aquabacterium terrae]